MKLKITTYPRIHISLIGMNNDGYRINGGAGFSIANPALSIYFEESDVVDISDLRYERFTDFEKKKLVATIENSISKLNLKTSIKATISGEVLPHCGFGSNTSIYLACLEALFVMNNVEYDNLKIIKHSTRGGTSGVGINTYFDGGFVLDLGVVSQKKEFLPSSVAGRNGQNVLVLKKNNLPLWDIGICIPDIPKKTEQEEIDFFVTNCPIEKESVYEILYEIIYGVTSSILDSNYKLFAQSINSIQSTKWKSLERSLYGIKLLELEEKLKSNGAIGVGMSSLGPTLYFLGEDIDNIIKNTKSFYPSCSFYKAKLNNSGRILYND